MNRTVYFATRSVIFAAEAPAADVVLSAESEEVSRTKVTKILETANTVAVVAADPDAAFEAFASGFARVTAAGGVVVDDRGYWLMIRRGGRWDLPKGHLEEGETLPECAAREICEETGVAARVESPLCETLHAYWFPPTQRWELKRTHWFRLRCDEAVPTAPQTEEGITEVAWCAPSELGDRLRDAFPTIRRVAEAMDSAAEPEASQFTI